MSYCKDCGMEIDWICTKDGRYIPVDPEPVFIVEGDGDEPFYDDEMGLITGRMAKPEEMQNEKDKLYALVGYVPHRRTCRVRRK